MKVKNSDLNTLAGIYGKLLFADFEGENAYKDAMQISEESVKIEDALRAQEKLKTAIVKKYKINEGASKEQEEKANEEYIKLLSEEFEIDLVKIKKDYLSKIKVKPFEIRLLDLLKLVE